MKLKILLVIAPLLTLSISIFANPVVDSVGVENLNGKKVVLHKLDPKDNYYSIGRRYNVSPKAIMQFNNNAPLKIGGIVKVPTEQSFTQTAATTPAPVQQTRPQVQQPVQQPKPQQPVAQQPKPQTQQPVVQQQAPATTVTTTTPAADTTPAKPVNMDNVQQYKVSAGETLYSIAKRFGTSVEDITKLNNLTSSTLTPNQVIKVRSGMPPEERPVAKQDAVVTTPDSTVAAIDSAGNKLKANRFGLYEKNETGVATWIDDTSLDPKKELVLHRTAPIGTVIKITNPMNNHTTYAKVVGRFTDSEATKDVLIVMTKNTADALGALDKRIHVNISYGSPNPNE
ncbi:LysM peptidoglycan-binding domain-containing protein [Mucilaginibacter sp. SG564]|uniref:LysM peptidoglycan-binding domain-containing protein n=1 Tax=Mucilaginibacter sp. SG564 TaxID=2587022 RepID=UPI001551AEED|nr:LysM peptidoglycan-binding domain-containing protein [Mucilaginibacter sp. SG564]NOW95159.1 LysM repeat protein [Mucilaginibacter sp. SG564]